MEEREGCSHAASAAFLTLLQQGAQALSVRTTLPADACPASASPKMQRVVSYHLFVPLPHLCSPKHASFARSCVLEQEDLGGAE